MMASQVRLLPNFDMAQVGWKRVQVGGRRESPLCLRVRSRLGPGRATVDEPMQKYPASRPITSKTIRRFKQSSQEQLKNPLAGPWPSWAWEPPLPSYSA